MKIRRKHYLVILMCLCFISAIIYYILYMQNKTYVNSINFILFQSFLFLVFCVIYLIVSSYDDDRENKLKHEEQKQKYINEYKKHSVPVIINHIGIKTSQYQTKNIYTGAILYTLPEEKALKLAAVNISGKNIRGFEIVLKNINVFDEITNEKKIVINQVLPNDYKPTEITEKINITDFNTYSVGRVVFSDGTIWSQNT